MLCQSELRGASASPEVRRLLDRTQIKRGPHYCLIPTIRLDETRSRTYHMADFFVFTANER